MFCQLYLQDIHIFYQFIFKQVVSTCQQNVSGNKKTITNTNIVQNSLLDTKNPDSRALENLGFVYNGQKRPGVGWVVGVKNQQNYHQHSYSNRSFSDKVYRSEHHLDQSFYSCAQWQDQIRDKLEVVHLLNPLQNLSRFPQT